MTLEELKNVAADIETVRFQLENGERVPAHFHVTEIGQTTKSFIDCGGTLREEAKIIMQLWTAQDFDHRLSGERLRQIIAIGESKLGLKNLAVEVEYQQQTVGKFSLDFEEGVFVLKPTLTACLASDACAPVQKPRIKMADLSAENCCSTSTCC
ncbi:MAG: DUF6428 family protein [Luteibaculaceae bacterium]